MISRVFARLCRNDYFTVTEYGAILSTISGRIDSLRISCYCVGMYETQYEDQMTQGHNLYRRKWLNINIVLIAVNIVIWVIMSTQGDTRDAAYMLLHGAMYPDVVLGGEWYRLFSAMFLHFGVEHLLSNMFMLYFLGDMLLRAVSQWKYAVIYLLSGVGGSVLSLIVMLMTGDYCVSAGASGAIYGVIGALLWVVLRNGGKFESISIPRMLFAVVLYISYGFTVEGVDAWAHLGGAIVGFLVCIVLYRKRR